MSPHQEVLVELKASIVCVEPTIRNDRVTEVQSCFDHYCISAELQGVPVYVCSHELSDL